MLWPLNMLHLYPSIPGILHALLHLFYHFLLTSPFPILSNHILPIILLLLEDLDMRFGNILHCGLIWYSNFRHSYLCNVFHIVSNRIFASCIDKESPFPCAYLEFPILLAGHFSSVSGRALLLVSEKSSRVIIR